MVSISGIAASSLLALTTITSALTIPAKEEVDGVFQLPIKKVKKNSDLAVRDLVDVPLLHHGVYYYSAEIYVGSQNSPVDVFIDTGSSDLLVSLESYDPSHSSTSRNLSLVGWPWGIPVDFFTDDVRISGAKTNLQFGVSWARQSLLGIGPLKGEVVPTYQNLPYALAADNLISKPAFSIYLENQEATEENLQKNITNGEILFGGIDHNKYEGELATFPILSDGWPVIQLDTIEFGDGSVWEVNLAAVLDTGTTIAGLPVDLAAKINETFGPVYPNGTIIHYDESWKETNFEFNFGSKVILVPYTNFLWADNAGGWRVFPITPTDDLGAFVLGDIILRNIYAVFDYELNTILIAQSAKNAYGGPSNITAIP